MLHEIVGLTDGMIEEAAGLAQKHGLRAYDAVHLAAALDTRRVVSKVESTEVIMVSSDVDLSVDADVAFSADYPETLFISSGGSSELPKNSSLALKILSKAFLDVELFLLRDRDTATDVERQAFLAISPNRRMLVRHEIENYLMDYCVLDAFCKSKGATIDKAAYDAIVQDINNQDMKAGDTTLQLKQLCGCKSVSHDEFKKLLAAFVRGCSSVYSDLAQCIFQTHSATPAVTTTTI